LIVELANKKPLAVQELPVATLSLELAPCSAFTKQKAASPPNYVLCAEAVSHCLQLVTQWHLLLLFVFL